jgi:uncharacterized membrane protein YcaP (DUF421 family)
VGMGVASYAVLLVVLRSSGKRTLAKLNAFDLVVTVALGSILATSLLSTEVALAEAAAAIAVLVAAQYVVAWGSVRSDPFRRAVRSKPAVLVSDGRLRAEALRQNRVSEGEVRQAVRSAGRGGFDTLAAVVLESDGSLSVIGRDHVGSGDALSDVGGGYTARAGDGRRR